MEVLFLCGAIQAFFFASLFYTSSQKILSHRILMIFFLLNGIVLLDHYLEVKEIIFEYPHLLGLTYTVPLLVGPLLYYYTLVLTKNPPPNWIRFFKLHSLLFVLLTSYFLWDYFFLSATEKLEYYYRESGGETSFIVYIAEFFLNLSLPFYSILSIVALQQHLKDIKEKFSYTEKINLKWLRLTLYFFAFISLLLLFTNLISDLLPIISFLQGDSLTFAALTFVIFFIGYFGIKQKVIYEPSDKLDLIQKNAYQKSGLKVTQNDKNIQRLLFLMEQEKLYLKSRLSLKDLATKMEFTENNLSQLMNEGLQKNFYDFVNEYRVTAVKKKILSQKNSHLTLLGIALESGFNSKSSFNLIFKKFTGQTPTQFKKENT